MQFDKNNENKTSIWVYNWVSADSDVVFVTQVSNDICVKYFWAQVKFSRINGKNYPIFEIVSIQAWVFTKRLERVCIWVAKNVAIYAFFLGKIETFVNLIGVKDFENFQVYAGSTTPPPPNDDELDLMWQQRHTNKM